jgi:hypothetical protein
MTSSGRPTLRRSTAITVNAVANTSEVADVKPSTDVFDELGAVR